jgi:hypothetical protein
MSTPSTPGTDQLVRVFIKMRNARTQLAKEFDDKDEVLKQNMKTIEIELLRRAQEQGTEGFKTKDGTTYISEEVHVSIADDNAFNEFLDSQENPYIFFEHRPSLKIIKEYQRDNSGNIPPGIKMFRENRMRVRAGKDK